MKPTIPLRWRLALSSRFPLLVAALFGSGVLAPAAAAVTRFSDTGIEAVGCASSSLCIAFDGLGEVFSSTAPLGGASAWRAQQVGKDLSGSTTRMNGVACPSPSLCVATTTTGELFTSSNPTGGAADWSIQHLADKLSSVSCPTVSLCVAAGSVAQQSSLLISTNPAGGAATWTPTAVMVTVVDPNAGTYQVPLYLEGVACWSASGCAAVGSYTADTPAGGGYGFVVTTNPAGGSGSWTFVPGQTSWVFDYAPFGDAAAVSCPLASLCLAGADRIATATNPASAGAWTETGLPANSLITSLSCPSTSFCVAWDLSHGLIESTNPTGGAAAWHAAGIRGGTGAFACPSAQLCVADVQGAIDGELATSSNPLAGKWQTFFPTSSWNHPVGPGCAVPRLVGKRLPAATRLLSKSHCRLGRVTTKHARRRLKGRVIAQTPHSGSKRPSGTQINVIFGK